MGTDHDLYYGDFERDGPDKVRTNLALKAYQGKRASLAQEWLDRLEAANRAASQAEQLAIARSAKDAAWEAANEARTANTTARIAAVIAAMALIVSIIALFWPSHAPPHP